MNNYNSLENWTSAYKLCPKCGSMDTEYNAMLIMTSYPAQYSYRCNKCKHHWTDFETSKSAKEWVATPNFEQPSFYQQGWVCPKCGNVMSPHQDWCIFCAKSTTSTITYETGTTLDNAIPCVNGTACAYQTQTNATLKKENRGQS